MSTSFDEDEMAYVMQDGSRYHTNRLTKIEDELDAIAVDGDAFWDSLTEEQRKLAFQAVVSRIYRGELAGSSAGAIMAYEFGFTGYHYLMVASNFDQLHNHTYIPTE